MGQRTEIIAAPRGYQFSRVCDMAIIPALACAFHRLASPTPILRDCAQVRNKRNKPVAGKNKYLRGAVRCGMLADGFGSPGGDSLQGCTINAARRCRRSFDRERRL